VVQKLDNKIGREIPSPETKVSIEKKSAIELDLEMKLGVVPESFVEEKYTLLSDVTNAYASGITPDTCDP